MDESEARSKAAVRTLLRQTRPLNLLLSGLTYLLGVGIADYLGIVFQPEAFSLGLAFVLLLQMSTALLGEVFRPAHELLGNDDGPRERFIQRNRLLLVASAALTSAGILVLLMTRAGLFTPSNVLFLGLSVVLSMAYAAPPFRLVNTGFGEFTLAILLANLPTSLAFLLQTREYHRLVGFVTFPLTLLCLSWLLALNFPTYAADQKYGRHTLLRRVGWQRAVPFHHSLLIAVYLTFLLAPLIGISLSLIWPAFLTLPFAVLQMLLVRGIALGGRPNWALLTATATAVFGLCTYFVTLSFWLR